MAEFTIETGFFDFDFLFLFIHNAAMLQTKKK